MMTTYSSTCNKSEHQRLDNTTHRRELVDVQPPTEVGGNQRSFRSSTGGNACSTHCRSPAECEAQFLYVSGESITLGSKNCSNGITSRGSYQSHSKPPKAGTDDPVNYYLPPPSPAPNSDRYIMEVMSPQSIQAACFDKYTSYYDSRCSTNRQVGNFNAHQQSPHQSLRHQPQATQIYSATSISPLDANGTCASNYNESYVSSLKQCSMKQSSRFRVSDRFREVPASNLLILNSPSSIVSSEHIYATTTDESSVPPVRYIPSANYLTQNPPFLTRDTYTYLRSTVHTPVKRYIPTPPNELSADITMQTSKPTQLMPKKCAYGGGNSNTSLVSNCQGLHNKSRYMNTIPNRLRVKCCKDGSTNTNTSRPQAGTKNNSHLTHTLEHRSIVAAEYSGTSTRPCTKNSHNNNITGNTTSNTSGSINLKSTAGRDSSLIIVHNQQLPNSNNLAAINGQNSSCFLSSTTSLGVCPSPFSVPSLSLSETPVSSAANNNNESQRILDSSHSNATISGIYANNINGLTNDYLKRTPSYEYENTTVVSVTSDGRNCSAPASKMERAISNNNAISYNSIATANSGLATTCMHCNTVRRTTGVHQTTQTTDPISPTPLQQAAGDMSLIGLGVCKSNFAQSSADESTFASTPSISESHSSPLPSSNGVVHNDGCGLTIFPSKIDENNSSTFVIDQMQQQKQTEQTFVTAHKSHQQKKTIIRQSTITEKLEVVGNSLCSQSVSSECHLLQASPLQPSHQQKQSINKCQQQQSFPIQELRVQEREEQQENVQDYSQRTHLARYIQKEISRFFGVDVSTEAEQVVIWQGRQRRLALRRFGALRSENELHSEMTNIRNHNGGHNHMYCYDAGGSTSQQFHQHHHSSERPDILPDHDTERGDLKSLQCSTNQSNFLFTDFHVGGDIERKVSVASMIVSSVTFVLRMLNKQEQTSIQRNVSRRFTPTDINNFMNVKNREEIVEGISTVQENDMYLASNGTDQASDNTKPNRRNNNVIDINIPKSLAPETNIKRDQSGSALIGNKGVKIMEHHRQIYISERVHGWRTSAVMDTNTRTTTIMSGQQQPPSNNSERKVFGSSTCSSDHSNNATNLDGYVTPTLSNGSSTKGTMGNRISAELIGSVLDKSHHQSKVGLFSLNDLDDRDDHRPFFTYWINTVQTLVLLLSVICYGIGPIGIGIEKKTGQVLVNSLSLQTVQHTEQRNIWIGPSSNDLVHLGAKFATCMRSDVRVMDVILKTRRQERETACCIRNDDSGCVQSSQTDCSLRGLFPAKSISTWKKWSAGESGPGGRISGSVCGLDPKYCDTPASISPHEWPDDITKWPICRKTNSFSQRFRYKDHTAEHMVCEVIAHPCCTGVYGECRITTREYCDFVNGYFHEEASLCSQISCLNNVCGMLPFVSVEMPDQFYRLFTSLCLHAGFLHLAFTIAFQHVYLADLERLIGSVRTAILYIGSGLAGNLTSAILVPYKPEVGPLASLSGIIASFSVLLIFIHWRQLNKPHIALCKLVCITVILFVIGTLPWQQNFSGILAGAFCGIFLTVALVPFVSVTEYGRKTKIKLIWACTIFHLFIYSVLFLVFYLLPTEVIGLNTSEIVNAKLHHNSVSSSNGAEGVIVGVEVGDFGLSSIDASNIPPKSIINNKSRNIYGDEKKKYYFTLQPQRQYYYHHRYSDITATGEHLLKDPLESQQRYITPVSAFYRHDFDIKINKSHTNGKPKYNGNSDIKNINNYASHYHRGGALTYSNSTKPRDKTGTSIDTEMKSNCKVLNKNRARQLELTGAEVSTTNKSNTTKVGKLISTDRKRTPYIVFNKYNKSKNYKNKNVKKNDGKHSHSKSNNLSDQYYANRNNYNKSSININNGNSNYFINNN